MSDSLFVKSIWLIPALPLFAAVLTAAVGARVLRERSHWPCIVASFGAALLSFFLLATVATSPATVVTDSGAPIASASSIVFDWINVGNFRAPITLRADPLTALMLVMVTWVGSGIVVYSTGYMHGDRGYWRFFAIVSLFLFAMTGLVLASNFLLIYVFWELVGLCSYLLIGFWYERPAAAAAAKKAFLVNRIGDFGFALGILLIWVTFHGTLDFDEVFGAVISAGDAATTTYPTLTLICLLLFCGAVGKSAQFPLHVWLPDAMEGPTPVSALIHAATMVTAGVYMVARCSPLFLASATASLTVSLIGGFTALLAALIALTQTDLKRILAYSTVSQLGYMFLGLGCGVKAAVIAAIFHVFTHAFFKALLFLGAGSVMHAMGGVIDIRRIGGLSRRMPVTCWTFACGAAALAGVPLLSGFWSKDAILAELAHAGEGRTQLVYRVLLASATLTAFLTAFYSFRAFFRTFWGEERIPEEAGSHAHESPAVMTWPLIVLSIFALGIGGIVARLFDGLGDFLSRTPGLGGAHANHSSAMMLTSGAVALAGVALAWVLYGRPSTLADSIAAQFRLAYQLSLEKFRFDEIYQALIVRPTMVLADVSRFVDDWVVDGIVGAVAAIPAFFGRLVLRPIQNGLLQYYAIGMVFGLVVLVVAMAGWLKF